MGLSIIVSYHDGTTQKYENSKAQDLVSIIDQAVSGWAVFPTSKGALTVHLGGVRSIETVTE